MLPMKNQSFLFYVHCLILTNRRPLISLDVYD